MDWDSSSYLTMYRTNPMTVPGDTLFTLDARFQVIEDKLLMLDDRFLVTFDKLLAPDYMCPVT